MVAYGSKKYKHPHSSCSATTHVPTYIFSPSKCYRYGMLDGRFFEEGMLSDIASYMHAPDYIICENL